MPLLLPQLLVETEPQSLMENKLINDMFTRNAGQYLYFKGSDYLSVAEKDLTSLRNRFDDTNLARHIEFCRGSRLSRTFKSINTKKRIIETRRPQQKEALESSV